MTKNKGIYNIKIDRLDKRIINIKGKSIITMKDNDIEEKAKQIIEEESKDIRAEIYKKALGENWYNRIINRDEEV